MPDRDYNKAFAFLMNSNLVSLEGDIDKMNSLERQELTLALEAIMERAATC